MNRKVKSFKQTVFLLEQCAMSKVTSVRRAVFRPWHRPTIVFPLVYCPVDKTLLEVSTEIRCSDASNHYCYYGNHAAGSKPILKIFITSNEKW